MRGNFPRLGYFIDEFLCEASPFEGGLDLVDQVLCDHSLLLRRVCCRKDMPANRVILTTTCQEMLQIASRTSTLLGPPFGHHTSTSNIRPVAPVVADRLSGLPSLLLTAGQSEGWFPESSPDNKTMRSSSSFSPEGGGFDGLSLGRINSTIADAHDKPLSLASMGTTTGLPTISDLCRSRPYRPTEVFALRRGTFSHAPSGTL